MDASDLKLDGCEQFEASPERLYGLLTDLDAAARFIPDLSAPQRVDEQTLRGTVRPGFSFLRGSLKLTITLVDLVPSTSATMRTDAKGIGIEMTVTTRMTIGPSASGGSQLDWAAQVEKLKGLVATVSSALIRGAADRVVRRTWEQIRRELGETAAGDGKPG